MITLHLDHHDFMFAVEGFARGSHLRQHVWRDIVYMSIPQMTDDEMDYFFFMMRRDLWECYFMEDGRTRCGHKDFLQALCALHRGNRYKVEFKVEKKGHRKVVECYRFDGNYKPLHKRGSKCVERFEAYIPDEWIITAEKLPLPDNRYVEVGKEQWWENIEQYTECDCGKQT